MAKCEGRGHLTAPPAMPRLLQCCDYDLLSARIAALLQHRYRTLGKGVSKKSARVRETLRRGIPQQTQVQMNLSPKEQTFILRGLDKASAEAEADMCAAQ